MKDELEIVLASDSPRRIEILNRLGLKFRFIANNIDEDEYLDKGAPLLERDLRMKMQKLALAKAKDVASKFTQGLDNKIVAGFDTVLYFENRVLGKPKNKADAKVTLQKIRNNEVKVFTGMAILNNDEKNTDCIVTKVKFKNFSDEELDEYLSNEEYTDKAGGLAIQGTGKSLIESYEGDFDNVVGLPVKAFVECLRKINK